MTNLVNATIVDGMATMNVSLPDPLKRFVEEQSSERGFGTSSEYVRDLIRHEQERTQMRALIVAGMTSGQGSELNADYFDGLRAGLEEGETTAS